jgi:hypothetical protein
MCAILRIFTGFQGRWLLKVETGSRVGLRVGYWYVEQSAMSGSLYAASRLTSAKLDMNIAFNPEQALSIAQQGREVSLGMTKNWHRRE